MLDGKARRLIEPALDRIATVLVGFGVGANTVTIVSFLIGMAACVAIVNNWLITGMVLLLLSRLGDGLDGAVARQTTKTDFGGYLDIVLDFAFYGAIPFAFVLLDPHHNAIAGAALILSFYINGSSFLAFATMAEKNSIKTTQRGSKSLYFATGLAEATETIAVFSAFCLFPHWFPLIAWSFAAICVLTTIARIIEARNLFVD